MKKANNYESIGDVDDSEFEWSLSSSTLDEDDCLSPTKRKAVKATRRAPTPVVIAIAVSQILLVAMLLLGWSSESVSPSPEDDQQHGEVGMLGSSKSSASSMAAVRRIVDDSAYLDMQVSCEDAFFHPTFHDYVTFQHAVGTPTATQVSPNIYQLNFVGRNVTLFVDYDDKKLELNVEVIGGEFDFFDTYHESITFNPLPSKTSPNVGGARRVQSNDRRNANESTEGVGCRLFRKLAAIFSPQAPITKEQWREERDGEILHLRDIVEASESR